MGIKASFKAFKTVVETQQIKSSGDYTIEQLFFIGYSTVSVYSVTVTKSSSIVLFLDVVQ